MTTESKSKATATLPYPQARVGKTLGDARNAPLTECGHDGESDRVGALNVLAQAVQS